MACTYQYNRPGGSKAKFRSFLKAFDSYLKDNAYAISLSMADSPVFYSALSSEEIANKISLKLWATQGTVVHINEALAVTTLSKAATTHKYTIEGKSQAFSDFQSIIATGLGNSIHSILEQYQNVGRSQTDIEKSIIDAKNTVIEYMKQLDISLRKNQDTIRVTTPGSPITLTLVYFEDGKTFSKNVTFNTVENANEALEFAYNKCEFLKRDIHGDFFSRMVNGLTFNDVIQALPGKVANGGHLLSEIKFTLPIEEEGRDFIRLNAEKLEITQEKANAVRYLTGIIDGIYVEPNGLVHIIDYKTHLLHDFGLLSDAKYVQQIGIYESVLRHQGFTNVDSSLIGFAFPTGTLTLIKIALDGRVTGAEKVKALLFANHFTGNQSISEERARELTKDLDVKILGIIPSARLTAANVEAIKKRILDPEGKDTIFSYYSKQMRKQNGNVDTKKTRDHWNEANSDNLVYFNDGTTMPAEQFLIQEATARMSNTLESTRLITSAFQNAKLFDQSLSEPKRLQYLKEILTVGNNAEKNAEVAKQLQDYLYGDWEIVPFEALNANNILLFHSKELDQYQMVVLTHASDLNSPVTFGKKITRTDNNGNKISQGQWNILGDFDITDDEFIKRAEKTRCIGYRDGHIEPISFGEIQQLQAVLLFQNYAEALGNHLKNLGAVKCISLDSGTGTIPTNTPQQLANTLDVLRIVSKEYDPTDRPTITPPSNVVYEDDFITMFTRHAQNAFRSDFDTEWTEVAGLVGKEKYQKMQEILMRKYNAEFSGLDKRDQIPFFRTEYGRLHELLKTIIYMCDNGRPPALNTVNNYGLDNNSVLAQTASIFKDGKVLEYAAGGMGVSYFWGGALSSSYANNPDNQVHQVNLFILNAIARIHLEFARDMGLINATIKKYLKAKSDFFHRYISGNQEEFYKQLLQLDENGVDPQMLFKNPFKDNVDSIEKECLEEILWYLNRRRNARKLDLTPVEQKMNYENFKKTEKYKKFVDFVNDNTNARYVPLRKADSRSKLAKILQSKENISDFYESMKEDMARAFDPKRFTSFLEMQADERKKQMVTMDRYSDSSHVQMTNEHRDPTFFSFDVGALVLDATLQSYQQLFFNETLQMTDLLIATIRMTEQLTGQDYSDKIENILNRIIIGVYGEGVLDKHLKDFNKNIGALKHISSFLKIAARPVLLLKESVVSLTKLWIKSQAGYFKGAHGITRLNFEKAMGIVWGAEAKNFGAVISDKSNGSDMSKVGMLNCIFGIANQDLNVTVENSKIDRFGLLGNWQRMMFKTSTAPDFYNRMGIMVAMMLQDGCYDAYTWNEDGNLIYDMAKDERYSYFYAHRNKNLSDEKFLSQKALYSYQLELFRKANRLNENGEPLKFGDKLPEAYTSQDIAAIKESIGTTLGFYDHDQASTTDKRQHAFLHFQFMGYLTGETKNWLNTSKNSFIHAKKQGKDAEGNLLYIMEDEEGHYLRNEDGSLKTTTESVDANGHSLTPYLVFEGHPVEGLLVSFVKTAREIKNLKALREKWKRGETADPTGEDWETVQQIANTKVCLWYLLLGNIFASLFALLFAAKSDSEKSEAEKQLQLVYNVLGKRILQEFNPWSSIVDPLLNTNIKGIDGAIDLFDDTMYVLGSGDPEKIDRIYNNMSAIRDMEDLADFFAQ